MSDKTIAEKLMIKEGRSVLFVNAPKDYKMLLGNLPKGVKVLRDLDGPVDVIQVFINSREELEAMVSELRKWLAPKGMLWVTYHKGTSGVKTDINRDSIGAYARKIGLEAVAIISVNDEWSALRLKTV